MKRVQKRGKGLEVFEETELCKVIVECDKLACKLGDEKLPAFEEDMSEIDPFKLFIYSFSADISTSNSFSIFFTLSLRC